MDSVLVLMRRTRWGSGPSAWGSSASSAAVSSLVSPPSSWGIWVFRRPTRGATNKGMSIAGIVLSVVGTVLAIVLYFTGVTAQLTSGFQS